MVILLLVFTNSLHSQSMFIINLHSGFLIPTADLGTKAAYVPESTYYLETNYGMTFDYNLFTGEIKYAFDKNGHIRGVLGLSLSGFINPGEILTLGFGHVERETMGIVSLYAGAEYSFLPKEKVNPFIGGNF